MPEYLGNKDYIHGTVPMTGVLLTNLGTPDAPTPEAVRRYLREFLWDPRVVEMTRWLWWPVLHGIVLPFRSRGSAHKYQSIWTDEGSPLLAISKRQARALQFELTEGFGGRVVVALGMRYGNPSIEFALDRLSEANARRVLVLPLYPQYSSAATASTFDAVAYVLKTWRWLPELRMVTHYHDDPGYIDAVARSIREYWEIRGCSERLLFSFHGTPKRSHLAGDPYFCECQATARLVAQQLQLTDTQWGIAFQSRFGRQEWLKPYCGKTLRAWAKAGVKSVDVVCPGFSADCLETLEEIEILNKKVFLDAGGQRYHYIPALNDRPEHIRALAGLVTKHTQGWPETDPNRKLAQLMKELEESRKRALALGAER